MATSDMEEQAGTGVDPREAIAALEAELASISARARPQQHGAAAYRLGMAYSESPGDTATNLRRALGCYEAAAKAFDARFDPAEHARVLNAAGSVHRQLGNRDEAARLFGRAVDLLMGRHRDDELASVLNNLGLVRTELGQISDGVAAFDQALPLFDATSAQGRRGRVATMHNRGLARARAGTAEGLETALTDYRAALADLEGEDVTYHHGLVFHSIGVAATSLAQIRPDGADTLLREALGAFDESLGFFSRAGFPYQHALAKYNQAVALAALGTEQDLRRALASLEDSLAIFDPRIHSGPWRQAYDRLSHIEGRLAEMVPRAPGSPRPTRADHFAALVAGCSEEERTSLLSQRILRLVVLPGPRRAEALGEWGQAVARMPREDGRRIIESELGVLMDVPNEALEAVLRGQMEANQLLAPEAKEDADRALDEAIGWAINGPQRVFVRDFLYSLGFERP